MTMNLYRVTCRGMTVRVAGNPAHGIAYVVANDSGKAYELVRKFLDDNDLGFSSDRALDKVELLAENNVTPECGYRLLIHPEVYKNLD